MLQFATTEPGTGAPAQVTDVTTASVSVSAGSGMPSACSLLRHTGYFILMLGLIPAPYPTIAQDLYFPTAYGARLDMDVGLVKLSSKITGTASIAFLPWVGLSANLPDGHSLVVAGAGVVSSGFCSPCANEPANIADPCTQFTEPVNVVAGVVK